MIKESNNPIYSINAEKFIEKFIQTNKLPDLPANLAFVKTGHGRQNSPLFVSKFNKETSEASFKENNVWFSVRTASIFRKLVIKFDQKRKISMGELSNIYGNSKNRGCKPSKHVKGSKYVIGLALKNLRDLEFINEGMQVTEKGMKAVDEICLN